MGDDVGVRRGGWILLLLLAGVVLVVVGSRDLSSQDEPGAPATAQTESSGSSQELPREVFETIALIESDGPFPSERDGAVFMNREGLLPGHERGYWHEYTVPTPGESDRGARRIVAGRGGELYYTADHYRSFVRVKEPR
jgi:ribonuclease T1